MATKTMISRRSSTGSAGEAFLLHFLALLCLMAVLDGYDFGCMAFAAPSIIREWHVDKTTFGIVFAAVTFGGMCGVLYSVFSATAAVTALLIFGAMSLATVGAVNVQQA